MAPAILQKQNLITDCFGCGTENEDGLHIESYWQENETICIWQPKSRYRSGNPKILNGGIIASLIDCHSINTAISQAYKDEKREPGSNPIINYVTGQLSVSYKKPIPIEKTLRIKAKILRIDGRKTWLESAIDYDDNICAEGKILAVRVV